MIFKLLMLGIWMVLIPLGIGYFWLRVSNVKPVRNGAAQERAVDPGYALCLGFILMWAVFQLVAVPFIVRNGRFFHVAFVFEMLCLIFALAGMFLFFLQLKGGLWKELFGGGNVASFVRGFSDKGKRREQALVVFLWAVVLAGLLFQVLQAYRLAYADGDDAFYIPISVAASQSGDMYMKNPYTGDSTELSMRYGLAPFPIWVAFIASKCQVNAAVAAHSLIPLVLIPVTYILYLELGKLLCSGPLSGGGDKWQMKKETMLPLFMIFVMLLQIFGNYSIYPASTFLLTRTRQGKAALGNVILPFFILLLYRMAEEIKERGKAQWQNVLWLMAAMTAGCLCSTMAAFLCGMLLMLAAFLIFLLYRKPAVLCQGFLGCIPGIVYALLYLNL